MASAAGRRASKRPRSIVATSSLDSSLATRPAATALLRGSTNPSWNDFKRMAAGDDDDIDVSDDGAAATPRSSAPTADTSRHLEAIRTQLRESQLKSVRTEAKLAETTSTVTSLRIELEKLRNSRDLERAARQMEAEEESGKVAELERQRAFFAEGEERVRGELRQSEERHRAAVGRLNSRIKELESEKQRLALELVELKELQIHNRSEKEIKDSAELEAADWKEISLRMTGMEVAELQRKLDRTQSNLDRERARADALEVENDQLRGDVVSLRVQAAGGSASAVGSADATPSSVGGSMDAATARKLRKLEYENTRLARRVENVTLLTRKLEVAEDSLARAQARAAAAGAAEAELAQLRPLRDLWDRVCGAGGAGGGEDAEWFGSPEGVAELVSDLRLQRTLATAKTAELRADLTRATEGRARAEEKVAELEGELSKTKARAMAAEKAELQQRGVAAFATQDREKLKQMIETMTVDSGGGAQAELVASYKQQIAQLQDELASARAAASTLASTKSPPPSASAASSQSIIESADQEGIELNEGDYDPRTTKILHMRDNPISMGLAERAEELSRLRDDVARLNVQLQRSDAGLVTPRSAPGSAPGSGGASSSVGDVSFSSDMAGDLVKLQGQNKQLTTKLQRLKEVYGKTVQDYRDALYQLIGYRIDQQAGNKYHLQSMYAEKEDDYLLFLHDEEGMQVLETPFLLSVKDHAEMYLRKYSSIPALLASITLELVSKQTMM
eukprot:m.62285 g.62285  ORF g.62285 m.62285 type:complete len:738 (+) comp8077_c0_seq1:26-2239(+)